MKLLFGFDRELSDWAAKKIPDLGEEGFGKCRAIGVASGETADSKLYAVAVYHAYMPHHKTCQMSIAADSPKWATKGIIRALLSVPFEQYKCDKVWAVISSQNNRALKLVEGIGFTREAVLGHHFGRKHHAVILRMMIWDYRNKYNSTR